ncbi:hypothetical protein E2K93_12580 [Thalassotalea sp. HSM 43]|uniref:hypothetical protein n=1 Tax=Thalassotalea sp. HSM 43 TaxID=2552945 RepID=UPI0010814472|nr:hypothetical protein [Thalassotalea sp. HSM 43]QBY05166.1 hypothetical protein E2K93_12580 [Thalassotalea sp. HSM 43]
MKIIKAVTKFFAKPAKTENKKVQVDLNYVQSYAHADSVFGESEDAATAEQKMDCDKQKQSETEIA